MMTLVAQPWRAADALQRLPALQRQPISLPFWAPHGGRTPPLHGPPVRARPQSPPHGRDFRVSGCVTPFLDEMAPSSTRCSSGPWFRPPRLRRCGELRPRRRGRRGCRPLRVGAGGGGPSRPSPPRPALAAAAAAAAPSQPAPDSDSSDAPAIAAPVAAPASPRRRASAASALC